MVLLLQKKKKIYEIVKNDRRVEMHEIAETVDISVGHHLNNSLD